MNTPNKFDLTPEAQQLLNVERRPMEPPAGAQARVRARVAITVGALAAGATAAGTAKAAGAGGAAAGAGAGAAAGAGAGVGAGTAGGAALGGGLLLKVLAPVGLGAVLVGTVAAPSIRERLGDGGSRPAVTQPAERAPAATAPAAAEAQPPVAEPTPVAAPEPTRTVRRTAGSSSPTLQAERVGLDEARAALADGRAAAALKLLAEHAREHPRGQLSEERDALTVMALAKDGKTAAARKAAAQFHARHPRSVLSGAVDAAVSSAQ